MDIAGGLIDMTGILSGSASLTDSNNTAQSTKFFANVKKKQLLLDIVKLRFLGMK